MPTIYVQEPVHEDAISELQRHATVLLGYGERQLPIVDVIGDIDGMLVRTGSVGAALIDAASNLKAIARTGVGYDNVDVEAASQKRISVIITPDSNYRSVAEHVFALLLAVRRRTVVGDRMVREGRFAERDAELLEDIGGSTLGILGLGRVGREVARIARNGFAMKVLTYDPALGSARSGDVASLVDEVLDDHRDVFRRSDAVTVHIPKTPRTVGFVGSAELGLMPSHGVLINAARGGIVDERALERALTERRLAGAGIDVFETEPPPADLRLLTCERVVLSPHSAGLTHRAVRHMGVAAARGLLDVIRGATTDDHGDGWLIVNPAS